MVHALQQDQNGEPVIEQWFRSKTMRHYQIALAERQEIAEALQRSLQMRAERDCFPLYPVYPAWPIHSKLPIAESGKPAYFQLQQSLTRSVMFRRLWEHWCHVEAILTWTEVGLNDIEHFIECAYASLSAKLYKTTFSFPLPDTWFDTLSHCGLSGHLHTDAMSTACNYFTASPDDVAQR